MGGVSAAALRAARASLADGVTGRTTHGRLITPDGRVENLVSGARWQEQTETLLRRLGVVSPTLRARVKIARHVEMQLAARLRIAAEEQAEAARAVGRPAPAPVEVVVHIDRPVCGTTGETRGWRSTV